jgi:hypothetical protein
VVTTAGTFILCCFVHAIWKLFSSSGYFIRKKRVFRFFRGGDSIPDLMFVSVRLPVISRWHKTIYNIREEEKYFTISRINVINYIKLKIEKKIIAFYWIYN